MVRSNPAVCAKLKISGDELAELKKYTWEMAEAFGLDSRLDRYQGKRPMSFAGEDFDLLISFTSTKSKSMFNNNLNDYDVASHKDPQQVNTKCSTYSCVVPN